VVEERPPGHEHLPVREEGRGLAFASRCHAAGAGAGPLAGRRVVPLGEQADGAALRHEHVAAEIPTFERGEVLRHPASRQTAPVAGLVAHPAQLSPLPLAHGPRDFRLSSRPAM
jgi:hypothetical protein